MWVFKTHVLHFFLLCCCIILVSLFLKLSSNSNNTPPFFDSTFFFSNQSISFLFYYSWLFQCPYEFWLSNMTSHFTHFIHWLNTRNINVASQLNHCKNLYWLYLICYKLMEFWLNNAHINWSFKTTLTLVQLIKSSLVWGTQLSLCKHCPYT